MTQRSGSNLPPVLCSQSHFAFIYRYRAQLPTLGTTTNQQPTAQAGRIGRSFFDSLTFACFFRASLFFCCLFLRTRDQVEQQQQQEDRYSRAEESDSRPDYTLCRRRGCCCGVLQYETTHTTTAHMFMCICRSIRRRSRRRRPRPRLCVYLYFFAYFFFSSFFVTTFRTFEYTISNNSTLVCCATDETHSHNICNDDFTGCVFYYFILRQISITKLPLARPSTNQARSPFPSC